MEGGYKDDQNGEWPVTLLGARGYNTGDGRFVTPDENLVDQHASDPLSWNLYSYARNNPLRYSDPTGRECQTNSDGSITDDGQGDSCNFQQFMTVRAKRVVVEPANFDRSQREWAMEMIAEAGKRASDGSAVMEGFKASRDRRQFLVNSVPTLLGVYVPPPRSLTAFPNATRERGKTPVQGGGHLRRRWRDDQGNIYEWDYQHGTVEKFNKRGKHLGEFHPETGQQTKPADPGKKVEP